MTNKKIIPYINAENEKSENVIQLAKKYSYEGADELLLYNYSKDEKSRNEFLSLAKDLSKEVDIPFSIGCYVHRLEDVKKALYTGASAMMIKFGALTDRTLLKEAAERFGSEKIILELDMIEWVDSADDELEYIFNDHNVGTILIKHFAFNKKSKNKIETASIPIIIRDSLVRNDISSLISLDNVIGVATNFFENKDIMKAKLALKEEGISVNTFESKIPFSEFKLNTDGLIPVITQDYKSGEVLMLAYMDEDAYNKTVTSGIMTYYSRSRNELWIKGETSGNYQYVKEITLDCDKDTLLAKVLKLGPACHTGNESCFYTELLKKDYVDTDPFHVLQDVYDIIKDRKKNPREGSYTNYLFEQGIDKILKKCGEESTEIIIAAKNPDAEELRYEIADYLYHVMVLMVECGLDWNDVMNELAHRK